MRSAAALENERQKAHGVGAPAREKPRGLGRPRAKIQRQNGTEEPLKTLAVTKSMLAATILCAHADFSRN
jgi:hypothetical protein